MEEDLALITRFKAGEMEAFEMLVKKYHNQIINTIFPLVGNVHDAEDITQEVFFKIYHRLDSFRAQAKFSSWLYRVSMNSAYDFLRKQKHKTISLENIDYADISDGKKPENIFTKDLVQDALNKIPFEFRTVIVLKEIDGLSYREIAEILKIRIGTVESRIYRARSMLKKIFIQKGVSKDEM